jgi:hypothetical protein
MTPPRSECPASSKLYGLMGSQGISDGGVNDGAIWPLFSALHAEHRTLNSGERGLLFSVRGRIRGVRGSVCYLCAEPWQERRVLMIPNCLQILIVIEGYLEAFSIERAEAEVDCLRLN